MAARRDNRNLRIAVIGCGHWGKNHVRIFSSTPGVTLAAVVDPDARRRRAALGGPRDVTQYRDTNALLAGEQLDAAIVATPAAAHYQPAAACLRAGLDVLVEKPLCARVADCRRLLALAKRHGRVLMAGHTFMYNPAVQKVKELLRTGACGKIYYLKARRTHLGLVREDVNAVWDLAPHDVYMFNHFLEAEPTQVTAIGGRYLSRKRADAAFINLKYPRGVIGNIIVSWADSNKERIVEIVGSRARILFDDLNTLEPVRIFEKGIAAHIHAGTSFGEFKYSLRDGDIISPQIRMSEPLKAMCDHFVECVRTRSRPLSDGRQGMAVVRVLSLIEKRLGGGR